MKPLHACSAVLLATSTLALGVACGPPGPIQGLAPGGGQAPQFIDDTDPYRARVTMVKDTSSPFVVDWPSENRGRLERSARRGPAIVHFDEQNLELLPDCEAAGTYNYAGFTPKREFKLLRSRAELHTNLPLSAVQLEGHLAHNGTLAIAFRMVGAHELDQRTLSRAQLKGRQCARATHFVRSMTIGAFRFISGASQEAGGGVGVMGMGAEGSAGGATETMVEDGNFQSCDGAQVDAPNAPNGCTAVLQIELVPLDVDDAGQQTPSCGEGLRWDGAACITVERVRQEAQQQPQQVGPAGQATPPAQRGGFECQKDNGQECLEQCKLGNVPSCYHLGSHFAQGTGGMPKDLNRALKLWDVACKAVEARACASLNVYYYVQQDWRRALAYGSAGCLAGDATACNNVAVQAFHGQGTAQNRPHAFNLWLRACKMRDAHACSNSGLMILHGMHGAPQDPAAAFKLLTRACESPGKEGCGNLGICYEHGLGVAQDLRRAIELYLKSCNEAGGALACVKAGLLIEENSSNAEHRTQALRLYEKACQMPPTGGGFTTEELKRYYPGRYSEEGYDRRACENAQHFALGCYNAAIAHERGYGGVPNRERAQTFLDRACQQGQLKKACRAPRVGTPTRT